MVNVYKVFMIVYITIFFILFSSASFGFNKTIRIGYYHPWTAGHDTLSEIPKIVGPGRFNIQLISWPADTKGPVAALSKNNITFSILSYNDWYRAINEDLPLKVIAEISPHLVIINESFLKKNRELIQDFLDIWQIAWLKSGYPYGIQPPNIEYLKSNYTSYMTEFSPENVTVSVESIYRYVFNLIEKRPVTWNKKMESKALLISRDYYSSLGVKFDRIKHAVRGKQYEGREKTICPQYFEIDIDPCNNDLVIIRKPYFRVRTGKSAVCYDKEYDIWKVTKR